MPLDVAEMMDALVDGVSRGVQQRSNRLAVAVAQRPE